MSVQKKFLFDASIEKIRFRDGTEVELEKNSILVVIGPNNSGKSSTLTEVKGLIAGDNVRAVIVDEVSVRRNMTLEEVKAQLEPFEEQSGAMNVPGFGFHTSHVDTWWGSRPGQPMGPFFGQYLISDLSTRARLSDCDPAPGFDARQPLFANHPFQHMYADEKLELRVSTAFRKAFRKDLVVHRTASQNIPVYVGQRPVPGPDEDRLSRTYLDKIESLDRLETQGDGVRSLASVVGRVITEGRPIQLIDEPEAFLHPPQARVVAEIISEQSISRQTLLATHSSDVIKGLLAGANERVSVVRLRRTDSGSKVSSLSNKAIGALWSDPVLRFSNVMDGLFHDAVVVAEAEADCRFYEALALASVDAESQLDVHYAYSGGKAKVAAIVAALRATDVPVASVLDFDVLNAEQPLRSIIEATGGKWSDFEGPWQEVKSAVESDAAFLGGAKFHSEVTSVLKTIDRNDAVPREVLRRIRALTRNASPWDRVKDGGLNALPKGQVTIVAESLLRELAAIGIFVAPRGEMEGFYRFIEPKGIRWVEEVVKLDLGHDLRLAEARTFAKSLYDFLRKPAAG